MGAGELTTKRYGILREPVILMASYAPSRIRTCNIVSHKGSTMALSHHAIGA